MPDIFRKIDIRSIDFRQFNIDSKFNQPLNLVQNIESSWLLFNTIVSRIGMNFEVLNFRKCRKIVNFITVLPNFQVIVK